ncbi:MAG: DUF5615 family PIN-like protein [Planctomycetia bacterium]
MSLAFYLDHHVPTAIADGLRQLQVDVLTVAEDGKADWDDDRLLERALEVGRVVFTQDRDFLVLAARCPPVRYLTPLENGQPGPSLNTKKHQPSCRQPDGL